MVVDIIPDSSRKKEEGGRRLGCAALSPSYFLLIFFAD